MSDNAGRVTVRLRPCGPLYRFDPSGGLGISTDDGKKWFPTLVTEARVISVARAGDDARLVAGTDAGPLFVTVDGGRAWERMDIALGPVIAIWARSSWETYVAAAAGDHVVRVFWTANPRTRGGSTWTPVDIRILAPQWTAFAEDAHGDVTLTWDAGAITLRAGRIVR
jgi:hypothetical protein